MKTLHDFYRLFPSRPALAEQPAAPAVAPVLAPVAAPLPVRVSNRYRERDFGSGYGRSSGYARDSRYTAPHDDRLLRVC
ncbi:hypothetical protein [Arenimonas sp. MALMAid1274]|uniref:hypothetical protein n=1 Tax=Arenimonas sp. MALMAid1274 TaxID=3411630 RepID=UPI003BA18FFA